MQKVTKSIIKVGATIGALVAPIVAFAIPPIGQPGGPIDQGLNALTATGLGTRPLQETVASIINVFMGLLGTVAIVIILIGGFQWMTAGGNEEKVDKAKKLLGAGVIGLAIILTAYSITRFVIGNLINAT